MSLFSRKIWPPLRPALGGERREHAGRAGRLSYYVAGEGPPLILVHSINAAASAFELEPLFERLRGWRRVYVPDLPGYGFSERSERDYCVPLFVDALRDMLDVVAAEQPGVAVDALALSLSSEFLARLAAEQPERFRSLTLVTPTGFSRRLGRRAGPYGATREVPGLLAVLSVPLWSDALYGLLVRRKVVRYFLKRTFGAEQVPEALVDYDWLTAHQPGARYAPLAFLSGRLFSADIRTVYERLSLPVWVPHATRGDFRDFSAANWTLKRPNWRLAPLPTGALPFFEQPDSFVEQFRDFLEAPPPAAPAAH